MSFGFIFLFLIGVLTLNLIFNLMKFIIGLGNPGQEYENTRHNIGFQIVDQFCNQDLLKSFKLVKKFQAETCEATFGEQKVILAKPQTFMNNSGLAVKKLKTFYKLKPQDIIVIHDDIDLPIRDIRISQGASSGGNKGIESIIKELKTKDFIRIRIGISNELRTRIPTEKFVLQNFSKEDLKNLQPATDSALAAIKLLIKHESLTKVQNKFNSKKSAHIIIT